MNGAVPPPPPPPDSVRWDPKRSAKGLKLAKGEHTATVSSSSEGWHTARSRETFSSGTHYVEFDVEEVAETPNTWKLVLGAVPPHFNCRAAAYTCVGSSQGGWGYVGGTGHRYCKEAGPDTAYGQAFGAGDTVGVLLDFAAGTVSFFRNRVCFGPAFATLRGPVHVAAAMTGKGTRVRARYVGAAPPFRFSAEYVQYPGAAGGELSDADRHATLEAHFGFKMPEGRLQLAAPEWAEPMRELTAMGFSFMDSAEALLVALPRGVHGVAEDPEARKQGVQVALEYLLAAPEERKPKYEVSANTFLRFAPAVVTINGKPVAGGLADQVVRLTAQLEEEQKVREAERTRGAHDVYRACLALVMAKGSVCKEDQQYLEALRKQRGLPGSAHAQALGDLGFDKAAFKGMIKSGRADEELLRRTRKIEAKQKAKGQHVDMAEDRECIVCLEKPRDMVIMNCMHVCVCEGCAEEYKKDGAECPTCRRAVDEVRKVYW